MRFPTFPVATPNPLVRREDLTPMWSSNAESHDSETLADLQRACIQAWKETPELGYFGSSQTQVQPPKAVVASNAFNTPIFGAGKSDKERYKNNKRKRSATAQDADFDEDLAYLAMVKRKKELVQRVPKKFVVGTFLCHLEGRETRFAEATRALAGKMSLTVRNLRPRAPEFQPANFICMEWDGGPVTIQYSCVFAEGVSHEIREDGYYYVPMDIRNELMQYAEHFDEPSDSDGEGVTHEDQEPECDPEPPASSSSSSSRKPAPKGPRGVTSKTRVSPPNHGPARATVV